MKTKRVINFQIITLISVLSDLLSFRINNKCSPFSKPNFHPEMKKNCRNCKKPWNGFTFQGSGLIFQAKNGRFFKFCNSSSWHFLHRATKIKNCLSSVTFLGSFKQLGHFFKALGDLLGYLLQLIVLTFMLLRRFPGFLILMWAIYVFEHTLASKNVLNLTIQTLGNFLKHFGHIMEPHCLKLSCVGRPSNNPSLDIYASLSSFKVSIKSKLLCYFFFEVIFITSNKSFRFLPSSPQNGIQLPAS